MKTLFINLLLCLSLTINAQFQEHIINSINYDVHSIVLADVDGDYDNDLIVSGGTHNQLKWFENFDGLGNFNTVHAIVESPYEINGNFISISDVDADNDIDILVTISEMDDGEIRTYNNTNGFGDFDLLSTSMNTSGSLSPIVIADIDGDSHNDWVSSVSSSQFNDAKVSWFKNSGNGTVTEQIIENLYLSSLQLTDLDNDNDIDLVGIKLYGSGQNELFWYENIDGLGDFSVKHTIQINTNFDYLSKILAADINNDGNMDIISSYGNIISWFENDGQGNFGFGNIINNENFTKTHVFSADLDNDGNVDILTTGNNASVTYFKNDGLGNFNKYVIIDNMYQNHSPIFAIDINGDNKLDIVSSSSVNRKLAWYENLGSLSVHQNNTIDFSIYPNPSKGIINIKSDMNISHIKVYNQLGALVLSIQNKHQIDISSLSPGIYFIKAIDDDGSAVTKKIIKK